MDEDVALSFLCIEVEGGCSYGCYGDSEVAKAEAGRAALTVALLKLELDARVLGVEKAVQLLGVLSALHQRVTVVHIMTEEGATGEQS